MLKTAAIIVLNALLLASPVLAQQKAAPANTVPAAKPAKQPAVNQPPATAGLQVSSQHPRLLLTPNDLPRLREMALARTLRWRQLLVWALEPAREGALPHDGPGLALVSLVLATSEPELSKRLGELAARCALGGARFGTVESFGDGTLRTKGGNRDPLNMLNKGYTILQPNFASLRFLPVSRYTASEVTARSDSGGGVIQAAAGDTYCLLQGEMLPASILVRQVALTLDWAWAYFSPQQRQGVARWLISQAQFFSKDGLGCFDSESAAALNLSALAALGSHGLEPAADDLLTHAWEVRFRGHMLPCLQNLGAGGGWFEGDTPGAQAGLDLIVFALALKTAAGQENPPRMAWYTDRLAYLLFRLLPGVAKAPAGAYRQVAPGGDQVLEPLQAAELTRMQMMALLSLRPNDRSARAARALLLDTRTPTLLAGHRKVYDFLWLDPAAPTAALATVPLSHLAPATGQAVMRSDWSSRSTWLGFNCGPHFAKRQHLAAASFMIFRQGFLLPQGGGYDGPTTSHALNYAIRSVAQNTLLVFDPQEYSWYDLRAGKQPKGTYSNDGGQRAWALFNDKGQPIKSAPWTASGYEKGKAPWAKLGDIYQVAAIEALEDQPRYGYVRGRAAQAYAGSTQKISRFVRHIFFLRANGPDDAESAEAVVVADDVELARKGLSVHFVLHFPEQPVPAAELKSLGPGRWRGPATSLVAKAGDSRLEVVPVWPPDVHLDILGGAGRAASWVGSRNYPPRPPVVTPYPWRAEYVRADAALLAQPMLHVLLPADQNNPQRPAIKALSTKDSRTIGVVLHDSAWPRVLVLRLGQPGAEPPISYRYPNGNSRHLVAGLAPGAQYTVKVDPFQITISLGPGLKATAAGLLAFRVATALSPATPSAQGATTPPTQAKP
ncbi:MAG: hypothetical protein KKC78_10930 [Proteobacteria bacterium]|nr:hypothetical protein [Pseudomonadota bacterium]